MSNEDADRRRRLSHALGAARSPSARRLTQPPPERKVEAVATGTAETESATSGSDLIGRQLRRRDSTSSDDSNDGGADAERAARRQSAMLQRIAQASNWDEGLVDLALSASAAAAAEEREASTDRGRVQRRLSTRAVPANRTSTLGGAYGIVAADSTQQTASPDASVSPDSTPTNATPTQLSAAKDKDKVARRRSTSRVAARNSVQLDADSILPVVERSKSTWTLNPAANDDAAVRQRARERIRGKSIDFRSMSNNSLLSPPDTPAVPSEETINAITSGYDDRLREILLESHTKNAAAAVAAAASVSYNGDAEQEEEYIGLNDETEATYERPRVISQSRSMSSPSIRAVKKRMSVPLHSMAGEATKAAAEQDLKSFMSQYSENKKRMSVEPGTMLEQTLTHGVDATVGDDDPNYVKPSIPKTNRNSIQMVRKRASVLQQAIENPSHSLSKVLADKKEAEELELLHNNEYSAPSKTITPRTASQDSISLLRRGSNPANSGSEAVNLPNEELINAVAEEVSFAGRVDPETGDFLDVSTADFVVSASGIVKTEHASYKPPQFRKISHSASLPHLQPLPKKESLQQSSSLKTFMEANGNSPSKRHSSNPSAASSTAAGSNDMIHPTLSLPRPPKKGALSRVSDNGSPTFQSKSSFHHPSPLSDSATTSFNSPPSRARTDSPPVPGTSSVNNTSGEGGPPRVRRESSIGALTGALSSAFTYVSKAAATAATAAAAAVPAASTHHSSAPPPEPSHFFVANDPNAVSPPSGSDGKQQGVLGSAFAYLASGLGSVSSSNTEKVSPKPVVAAPQYVQLSTPVVSPGRKVEHRPSAYGLGGSLGKASGVVEDWWRGGFGGRKTEAAAGSGSPKSQTESENSGGGGGGGGGTENGNGGQ